MTNTVSVIRHSLSGNACIKTVHGVRIFENDEERPKSVHGVKVSQVEQESVFNAKNLLSVNKANAMVLKEYKDKLFAEKEENEKNKSFLHTLKRIGKGAVNGIKNTFEFLTSSPPTLFASAALVMGLACASHAMLGIVLVSLGAALAASALSGIVYEFKGNTADK